MLPLFLLAAQSLNVGGDYPAQLDRWLTAQADERLAARAQAVAGLRTRDAIVARGAEARRRMLAEIGGLPARATPLNARITGRFERPGYRVENLIFESQPGFKVTANLYLPTSGRGPFPAVLGVAGHSNNGKASATYQHAWIGFVKRGIAVLAYDPPGQGERSEYLDAATGKSRTGVGTAEHTMAGVQCLLTGQALGRYFIHDGIRAFDYLVTRPEIDAQRIAVAGNSGGGTQAAYLAAFEPRLAAIVSSCYMTGWKELWRGPGPQDAEQVFPGLLRDELDFGDFLLAAELKPYLMTTAIQDFFPIAGARATYQEAVRLFERAGVSERAGYFEFDDTHGWSKPRRQAAYRWLDKWFFGRTSDGAEPEIETEAESTLYATPTGHLATSGGSATVRELNAAEARKLAPRRPVTRAALEELLQQAGRSSAPPVVLSTQPQSGYGVQKLEFEAAGGVRFPALLFEPAGARREPAILLANGNGKAAELAEIEELVRAGHVVLAVDPRGMGEGVVRRAGGGYTPAYQAAARAWLLGQHLAGYQVADLRQAFAYLKGRGRVALWAKGVAGPVALLAAALEPGLERVALERSILSYTQFAEAAVHEGLTSVVIPGVLKSTDLPELGHLFEGRRPWVVSPVTPNGVPVLAREARPVYPWARVVERPEGHAVTKVYREWLSY